MNRNETIAEICESMRNYAGPANLCKLIGDRIRDYADRIEAAAERERGIARDLGRIDEQSDQMERAANTIARSLNPGNASAMREALERLASWDASCPDTELHKITTAAIAAPARNCDRFETADEAEREYCRKAFFAGYEDPVVRAAFRWAFAPAEGGAE